MKIYAFVKETDHETGELVGLAVSEEGRELTLQRAREEDVLRVLLGATSHGVNHTVYGHFYPEFEVEWTDAPADNPALAGAFHRRL